MAKREVNKTEIVRRYLSKNPDASPKDVSRALRRYGITPGYISNIKTKLKKEGEGPMKAAGGTGAARRRGRRQATRPPEGAAATTTAPAADASAKAAPPRSSGKSEGDKLRQLYAAIEFMKFCGSASAAREALEQAEKLRRLFS